MTGSLNCLRAHSRAVVAGARGLRALPEGGDVVPKYRIVMDREHDADGVTRGILIAVRRSLITPFDRRCHKGPHHRDGDAVDQMEKTAKPCCSTFGLSRRK
jgi:uncharacterized protein Yka (UPF0111/DUF47 family)